MKILFILSTMIFLLYNVRFSSKGKRLKMVLLLLTFLRYQPDFCFKILLTILLLNSSICKALPGPDFRYIQLGTRAPAVSGYFFGKLSPGLHSPKCPLMIMTKRRLVIWASRHPSQLANLPTLPSVYNITPDRFPLRFQQTPP